MKKFAVLLVAALLLTFLASCGITPPQGELQIVATSFAGYDFAAEIIGRDNERVSLTLLSGGDAHSFDPTFNDMAKIRSAELFIYVGGVSDTAIETLIADIEGLNVFRLVDSVELLEEEGEHDHEEDSHESHALDEHVWTSLANAILIVTDLVEAICEIDPDNAQVYRENGRRYLDELSALHSEFKALFDSYTDPTLIFGDRFPFLYMARDYGFHYEAAFPGCSSASEPTLATVTFLIDKVKSEGHTTVFHIEGGEHSVADRIASATGTKTALFHACHKVTASEIASGVTYLSLMQDNYNAVKTALARE